MSRLIEKTTATLLIAIFMISIFAVALPVMASEVTIHNVNTLGRPVLVGTISSDGVSVHFHIRAVGQADDGDANNPSKYYTQSNFDNEYFTISAAGKFLKYNMFSGTTPYWGPSWGSATNPLPDGVTFSQAEDGADFVYAVSMSYVVLGVSEGDTFLVQIKARDFNDDYVQSYSGYVGFDGEYSQYRGLYITDTGVFDVTIPTPAREMDSFIIEHAKIDFKKKIDDYKVKIKGHYELDLENGDGVNIEDEVTLTISDENVEVFSQTILMVEKGKGEKWEYKRTKGETGGIKHMKIHWKDEGLGKFDVKIDGEYMDVIMNPVTIKLEIGDHVGEETIAMRVHKHHWDYKAKGK